MQVGALLDALGFRYKYTLCEILPDSWQEYDDLRFGLGVLIL